MSDKPKKPLSIGDEDVERMMAEVYLGPLTDEEWKRLQERRREPLDSCICEECCHSECRVCGCDCR